MAAPNHLSQLSGEFGSALRSALDVTSDEMKLVQMEPERIFRVATRVAEGEFREKLKSFDVSCPGKVHFWEVLLFLVLI